MKIGLSTLGWVLLLSALTLGGCRPAAVEPQDTPLEPRPATHLIELREGDTYPIALESDGDGWQVEFNEAFLELVEDSYDPDSDQEIFTFRALRWGHTEVYFSYSRRHEVIYIFNIGVDPALAKEMTLEQAREIAANSECAEVGALREGGSYNDWSGTWWIDLDAQKEGCAPACVVHVRTREAEVNWRCTGAIPGDRVDAPPAPPPTGMPPTAQPREHLAPAPTEVSPTAQPIELPTPTASGATWEAPDPSRARDAALAYVSGRYGEQAPALGLTWTEKFITPERLVGSGTLQYSAQDWVVTITYPLVAPEAVVYQVVVANPTTGFQWGGEVDPAGQVTESRAEVPTTSPTEVVTEGEYGGWNTYTSERFGYALRYPGECSVMGTDLDKSVQFVGPIVNNEHWPWFFVDHYDSDFYHPAAGTDVHQWIADSGHPYGEIGPQVDVAGLPTVHFIYGGGPGAYDSDHYLFIKGDQLFHIMILHSGGRQDWDLYNKFLQSFTFP